MHPNSLWYLLHFLETLLTWHFDWIEAISHWMFVHRIESKIESNTVKATQVLKSQPRKISARSDNIQTTVFSIKDVWMSWNFVRFLSFLTDKKVLFLKKIKSIASLQDSSSFYRQMPLDVLTFLIHGFDLGIILIQLNKYETAPYFSY